MKRIIFILWAALASNGWLMANHWTPDSTPYEDNMTLTGIVRIDGVEQQTTAIELGAFCGEECRGSGRLAFFPPTQHFVVQMAVFGESGDEIAFRLYNHDLGEELELISLDTLTFTSEGYGSLANPYLFNFYSQYPGPHVITVTADPMEYGTVTGGGSYDHFSICTLTATANEDYAFVNWTKEGEVVSTDATYSFEVTEPGDYVAHFELGIIHHWTPNGASFEDNMTLTGVVKIDGQEQQNPMLEVAAFCGEECRGSGLLTYFAPTQRYVVQMAIYGNSGDAMVFKLYDHEVNEELDVYPTEAISFTTNGYGSLANPYVLDFTETVTETHTVSATVNPVESGTVEGTGTYLNGATCTLTATPNEGYAFVNWTENGTMVSVSSSYEFEVTSDLAFVANFVPIEGNHWTPNTAPYEDNMTLTGVVLINYVEQQTTALEVGVFCGEECRGTGRLTFFPLTQRYVVQMVVYGESGDELTFKLFDHVLSEELDLVSPAAIAFTEDAYGTLQSPYMLNFLETFAITVSANPTEGGTTTGAGVYNYGTAVTLSATPNTGYHFVNWTKDNEVVSTNVSYSFTVTQESSFVANFELNSYDITATANPEVGGTVEGAGTYNHFETCTLTATANEGYTFLNWTLGGEVVSNSPTYSFTVTEASAFVANFELNSYEITATANPEVGGTVEGAGTYNHFETCTLTAMAATGYHFVSWTLGGEVVSNSPIYSFTVTEASAFVANFELNSYDITAMANPTEGGTVEGAGTYNHFETCTLTATASEGYHFVNWMQDGEVVSNSPTYSFTVTEAASFVANFELNSYDITAEANPTAGGTVEGAGTYNHFETCTLTATANEGYTFLNWTHVGEVVSNSPTYSFTVTEASAFVANFELNSYDITATANPEAGGTVTGAGTYNHFETCTLTATANEGYAFINWTLDGEEVSTEAAYSFEVTGPAAFVANFELTAITQTSGFVTGWNWWSSYVELDGANSLQSLQDGLGTSGMMIKSQNDGYASYLAGFGWYGSLTTINNESTYQIRASEACTVEMTGSVANPEEHPITLSTGWTWVGYPVAVSMGVQEALAGITPQNGDMLKSQNNGYASYLAGFGWYGSLNTLQPGMGLMFKSNNSSAVTLVYPNGETRTDLKANQTAESNYWQPNLNAYPDNMSVMAVIELDGNELQGENYELAAFANGEVRGSARLLYVEPLNRYMAFLTVAGDEAAELHFGLYDTETGAVETQCVASLQYETNAVVGSFAEPYVVSFRGTTGVDEWARSLQVYPNPVEHGQVVSLGFDDAETGEVRVEIINALGAVVETQCLASPQTIHAPNTAGVYTLRITVEGKETCYRKLVVR